MSGCLMRCPDLLVQAPHVRSDWSFLYAPGWMGLMATLDGADMRKFAVGSLTGIAPCRLGV